MGCAKRWQALVEEYQREMDAEVKMETGKAVKRIDDWTNENRPLTLVGAVLLTIAIAAATNLLTGQDLFRKFFFPKPTDPLEWKDLFQAALLVLGLPVAFLLWHWRDRNVRDQLEVQRKDVNLKEFQEVQLRAVGVHNSDNSQSTKDALQIAALHHLRGFLAGDFGYSFRRPAFETYFSLLEQETEECGEGIEGLISASIFNAIRAIVFEEWKNLFWEDFENKKGWPLEGRSLRKISLPPEANLAGLNLARVDFSGSNLSQADFSNSRCWDTNFSNCNLRSAILEGSSFEGSNFNEADLAGARCSRCDFSNSYLGRTKFHAADLSHADFSNVKGTGCFFVNTNLEHSNFNGANLSDVDFQSAQLCNSKFVSARIRSGNVKAADLSYCDFSYAEIDGFFPTFAKTVHCAKINKKTKLSYPDRHFYEGLTVNERRDILAHWQDNGAILAEPIEELSLEPDHKSASQGLSASLNEAMEIALEKGRLTPLTPPV